MKIKKLQIKNFQSHKDTTLEFDGGLNIIVGPTNSGKSSIFRALKKVIRDTPSGNNFVNIDEKECLICIETDTNEITRRIGVSSAGETKTNEYTLDNEGFAKFGKEIPIEIIQALKMPEIEFDTAKVDLNFADQLDSPFLLSATPSLKAKILGKLSGVDILDRAITKTNKNLRELNNEIKSDTLNKETLEKELSEFIDIEKCEEQLKNLEQKLSKTEKNISLLEKLRSLKISLEDIVKKGKEIRNRLEELKVVDTISFDSVEKTFEIFKEVNTLNSKLDSFNVKENILTKELKNFEKLNKCEPLFVSVESTLEKLKNIIDFEKHLVIFKKIEDCEKDIDKLEGSTNTKIGELNIFLKKLKVCPTCGQELSANVIEKMI